MDKERETDKETDMEMDTDTAIDIDMDIPVWPKTPFQTFGCRILDIDKV
jgi:hypothetical protein